MSARFRGTRVAAVVLGASLAVLGAALPASAGPDHGDSGASKGVGATPNDDANVAGKSVTIKYAKDADKTDELDTSLLGLSTDSGRTLHAYCIEVEVWLKDSHMHEVGWKDYPNADSPFTKNNAKINWVLQHSYPNVDVKDLADAAGADGLSKKEAIAATQAAIWHYSDGTLLVEKENNAAIDAVYDHLTGEANTGIDKEPAPSLKLTPNSVSGEVGDLVGPMTVATSADAVKVEATLPKGVEITDADGKRLDTDGIDDGTEIYFKVPADAKPADGNVTVTGDADVLTGRVFVSDSYDKKPSQSLILANSTPVEVSKKATVTWTPATAPTTGTTTTAPPTSSEAAPVPTTPSGPGASQTPVANASDEGDLAYTGVSIGVPIGIAALLLVGGGALLLLQRKRKRKGA